MRLIKIKYFETIMQRYATLMFDSIALGIQCRHVTMTLE